jgi:DNA-binding transcriptional LysR family regulator
MLEDFRLRVFVTVAQAGSFTMAAVQLGITQPAVSQHVSELEKNYGVRLFDRLRGAIVLTPSGELFYEHAVEILQQYSDMHQMLQRFPERIVRVSASEDVFHYLVTTVLDRFQKVHPEIGFQHSFLQNTGPDKLKAYLYCIFHKDKRRGAFSATPPNLLF